MVFVDAQFFDISSLEGPQVNRVPQGDTQVVVFGPVQNVHVEIVLEVWGVQDFEWGRV